LKVADRPEVDGAAGRWRRQDLSHLCELPVNTQVAAYYNVVLPDYQANWQIRAQVQFMFPR
jgi:hypothetical protein